MAVPLLRTKLYISPLQSEIVPRHRLVEWLNTASLRSFTLISAPAGFGKTTLLQEWISNQALKVSWFSIDRGDNDPVRFWTYVVAALQTVTPVLGKTISAALQSPQPPLIESLLAELINEISARPGLTPGHLEAERFILVLDDYHLITETRVHDSLIFFLENLPPQVHLIISSRADPPWPLARLRARCKMAELRAEELRFTSQEISTFLNQVMKLKIGPEDMTALEKRTEGWIVGLQMAALSMQKRSDVSVFIKAFAGTNRFILDYLLEEVLEQQPPELQDFLLKTSLLNQVTAPLCDFILDQADSQKILSTLEGANLFLVPLDDQRQWYRYHHLFSELLHNQLTLTYPEQVPNIHQKASEWFEKQGYIDETIAHAFAAHDDKRVAHLCEKFGQGMLEENKHSLLSTWIETLPEELVQQRPWLCVYQSWTRHWAGLRTHGEACLDNAEKLLVNRSFQGEASLSEDEIKKLKGSIATVRAHYALVNEQLPLAIEQAKKALHYLPKTEFYTLGTAGIALGGAYWGQGKISKAEDAFLECTSTALNGGFLFRAASALCYAGMQQVKAARLRAAENSYQQALSLVQSPGRHPYPIAGYPLAKLSELALEWNNLDQALKFAKNGVELCSQLGHVDLIAEAYIALARAQLTNEDFRGVHASLHQVEQLALQTKLDPWVLGWSLECKVRSLLAIGDLDQASLWVRSPGLGMGVKFSFHHDLHHITLARVLVAQVMQNSREADPSKCIELLDGLLALCNEMGWSHHKIQILILQGLVFQAAGNQTSALGAVRTALELAEPERYLRTFISEGPPMAQLLQKLAKQGKSRRYAHDLLKAFPVNASSQQPDLVEPLSRRELEVLKLLMTSLSVSDIAGELTISVNTVRSHIKHIYGKLGVNRRLDMIEKAKELHLDS